MILGPFSVFAFDVTLVNVDIILMLCACVCAVLTVSLCELYKMMASAQLNI